MISKSWFLRYDNNIPLEVLRRLFLYEASYYPLGMKNIRYTSPPSRSNEPSESIQEPKPTP